MRKFQSIFLLMLLVISFSCRGRQTVSPAVEGDTLRFRYATQLTVVRYQDYTVARLKNPWKPDKLLHTYILVPADRELPQPLPAGTVLRTPLSHSAVFTTVHCALLSMLGREEALAGVADLKYIKQPWVQRGVAGGLIADYGDGMSPVVEKIIDTRPDAIFLSPFENAGGYGRLEEIDIPIVECAEYMEQSPLGRAEWMRFYGMLFGCEQRADSLFALVESSYQALAARARKSHVKPTVVVDKVTGSVWYVPGGHSTIGRMMADANAAYVYADDTHSGSVALPFESVLEHAGEAQVWHFRYSADRDITYPQLLSEHRGYANFQAYRQRRVYACDVSRSQFYEETPFRPDLLLADFIQMLHPDLPGLPAPRYYHQLK